MHPALVLGILVCTPISGGSGGSDWPQFRGPSGTGAVPAADIPLEWGASKNVAWKVALPGQGWSQAVVVGGTVYLTTAVGEGLETPMGMAAGIADPRTQKAGSVPDATIDWRVIALDLASGKERWSQSVVQAKPKFPIHPSNTWATETPVADAGGVVAFFGATGTLAAFDPSGKALWKAELGAYPTMQGYGTGSSPAIHDGKVFVQCFNDEKAFVACFDAKSGKELWRVQRESAGTTWASPLVWRNEKRVELVCSGPKLITSHDLSSGKELWKLAGLEGPSMCSFGADAERLYFGQASPMGSPPLYALTAGGAGDLSPATGSTEPRSQAWAQKAAGPTMPSPVAADGLLYVVNDNLLTCRDASTGEQLYKERVGDLVTVAASPIVAGDKLLLLDEEGRAALVQVGPEFEIVGRGKLDDVFWTTPSVAGDALLIRGLAGLYCVRK
jgi:outer membrane protein assembly factor BamB